MPEVCGSNPFIGKLSNIHLFTVNCFEKDENKEKEAGNGPFLKKNNQTLIAKINIKIGSEMKHRERKKNTRA